MIKIEVISGSPRAASVTKRVATHLVSQLTKFEDIQVGFIDIRHHLWGHVETVCQGTATAPAERSETVRRVFEADAFILVSPEYNGSYSPALKSFLDHFPKQSAKVFGIVTASPGSLGGIRAAVQLQTMVYGLMGIGSPQMLVVPEVDSKFSNDGELMNAEFAVAVSEFIDRFLWLTNAVTLSRYATWSHPRKEKAA